MYYFVAFRLFSGSAIFFFLFFMILFDRNHRVPGFIIITFLIIPVIFSVLGICYWRLQKRRLRLVTIETKLSRIEIKRIILELSKEFEWEIDFSNKEILIAITSPPYFFSLRKERITFLFNEGCVLLNSISLMGGYYLVFSNKRNKKNIKIIQERISAAGSK